MVSDWGHDFVRMRSCVMFRKGHEWRWPVPGWPMTFSATRGADANLLTWPISKLDGAHDHFETNIKPITFCSLFLSYLSPAVCGKLTLYMYIRVLLLFLWYSLRLQYLDHSVVPFVDMSKTLLCVLFKCITDSRYQYVKRNARDTSMHTKNSNIHVLYE